MGAVDIDKIIGLIKDSSAKLKAEGLKMVADIDWSVADPRKLTELLGAIESAIDFPRADIRLSAEKARDQVQEMMQKIMKEDPEAFAEFVSGQLVSEEEEIPRERRMAKLDARKTRHELETVKTHVDELKDDDRVEIDFSSVTPRPIAASSEQNKQEQGREDKNQAALRTDKQIKKEETQKKTGKPQIVVVHASVEGRFTRFINTFLSFIILAAIVLVSYGELIEQSRTGVIAGGILFVYVVMLLLGSRVFTSTERVLLGFLFFFGLVFYQLYIEGNKVDFGFSKKGSLDPGTLIVNITFILSFLVPMATILFDRSLAAAARLFVAILGVFSILSLLEGLASNSSFPALILESGSASLVPFIFLKPFYFGINIFLPLAFIIFLLMFIRDLFSAEWARLLHSFTAMLMIAVCFIYYVFTLNELNVTNISNAFIPNSISFESPSLPDNLYRKIASRGPSFKNRVLDCVAQLKAPIQGPRTQSGAPVAKVPEVVVDGVSEYSFSPNGRWLAYSCKNDRQYDIVVMDFQTRSEPRILVGDGSVNRYPAFSPDSTMVAFISNKGGTGDNVWMINPNSTGLEQVTFDNTPKSFLMWAPHRNFITYISEGKIVRFPVKYEVAEKTQTTPARRVRMMENAAKAILGLEITAQIDYQNQAVIKYKTMSKDPVSMLFEIQGLQVLATRIFEDFDIYKVIVTAEYFTHSLKIASIPSIVKQNIEDTEFLKIENVKNWLSSSEIYLDDRPVYNFRMVE